MTLRRGSTGSEVERIQQRLRELQLYRGPIDGNFGGGTESAVKSFQTRERLNPDGLVGPLTWDRLFRGESLPATDPTAAPVAQRCLALTGSFETGSGVPDCYAGLTGDFDGQGLSLGVLQWNFGQGSLQPLLREMITAHRAAAEGVLHEHLPVLEALLDSPAEEQLAWARSIQDPRRKAVFEPWRGLLKSLARTPQFQSIECRHAAKLHKKAEKLCSEYGLGTERGVALMFDILTQNGSISPVVKAQIVKDFERLAPGATDEESETARMRVVANRRAAAARPEFVEDVRSRKLTIAEGRGSVHGIFYNLEEYGLRLRPFRASAAGTGR